MAKNSKTGRPAYKPTPVQRRLVRNAAASGMSHEEIAIALEIHRHTLEKYFPKEISSGALLRRMQIMDAMVRTAMKGNVTAQKALLATLPALGAPQIEPEKPDKLGKKDQANADARTASSGTEWDALIGGNVTPLRKAG